MDSITVGFSKPKSWKPFAWIIMKGYGIPYDHVYVKFHSDSYDRDIIYQASKTMVNFMSPTVFESENLVVKEFKINITDENKIKMIQFAIDNAGKPYGILECFGMAIVRVAELLGRKIRNPFKEAGSTYVCSVLAGYVLEQYAGQDIPADIDDMTPLVVFNYLSALKTQ